MRRITTRKRCKQYGCPNLHNNKNGYCDECNRKYRAKHPGIYKEDGSRIYKNEKPDNRPSSQSRGYTWKWRQFALKYLKSHPICARCGAPARVVDHKTDTARMMMDAYGEFDFNEDNYQPLCYRCNNIKGINEDREKDNDYFMFKSLLSKEK